MRKILFVCICFLPLVVILQGQYIVENSGFIQADSLTGCDSMEVNFSFPVKPYTNLLWNFGNGESSSGTNPTIQYDAPGDYTVTLLIDGDTLYREIDFIRIRTTPDASFTNNDTALMGSLTLQFVVQNPPSPMLSGYSVLWDFGDGSVVNVEDEVFIDHAYAVEDTYVVKSHVSNLICESQYSDTITVGNVFDIPNVFTPNDDGINDLFMVNSNGIDDITLEIFNRWGSPVFKRTAKTVFWDGHDATGKACQPGVYYYIVYSSNGQDKQEGFVHLYR
jgi:gliding motility-associated-like protein